MAYQLTLTKSERSAINWIGYRYSHGDDLYKLLCEAKWSVIEEPDTLEIDWDYQGSITFTLNESLMWEVCDLLEDSHYECFSGDLQTKFLNFVGSVV